MNTYKFYRVEIRFSEKDYSQFIRQLNDTRLSKSEYIKRCVLDKKITYSPDYNLFERTYAAICELKNELICFEKFYDEKTNLDKNLKYVFIDVYNKLVDVHNGFSYEKWDKR